jgi:hypothetical protein
MSRMIRSGHLRCADGEAVYVVMTAPSWHRLGAFRLSGYGASLLSCFLAIGTQQVALKCELMNCPILNATNG